MQRDRRPSPASSAGHPRWPPLWDRDVSGKLEDLSQGILRKTGERCASGRATMGRP